MNIRFRRPMTIILATVCLLLLGCGPGDQEYGQNPVIEVLPNGVVWVENPPLQEGDTLPTFVGQEDLRIGSVAGGGPDEFSRIGTFTVDDQGTMYIVDGMAEEIRVFDPDGNHIRTFGGKGEGPGEFSNATGMTWGPEGNLWVYESRRFSVFSPEGEFLTSYPRVPRGRLSPWPGKFDSEGRLWDFGVDRPEAAGNSPGTLIRYSVRRTSHDFSSFDTLRSLDFRTGDLLPSMASPPYYDGLTRLLDPQGFFWFARTRDNRVYQVTADYDTIRGFSIPIGPVPVSDAEIDSIMAAYNRPGRPVRLEAEDIPPTKTLVRRILMDDRRNIVIFPIASREDQNKVFLMFDEEGVFLGRGRLENRVYQAPHPIFKGGYAYSVVTDELDISYLVRERIVRK